MLLIFPFQLMYSLQEGQNSGAVRDLWRYELHSITQEKEKLMATIS